MPTQKIEVHGQWYYDDDIPFAPICSKCGCISHEGETERCDQCGSLMEASKDEQ